MITEQGHIGNISKSKKREPVQVHAVTLTLRRQHNLILDAKTLQFRAAMRRLRTEEHEHQNNGFQTGICSNLVHYFLLAFFFSLSVLQVAAGI